MKSTFRFGVSTCLLVIGWMLLPWSAYMLPGLPFAKIETDPLVYLDRFFMDVVPLILAVAMALAFVTLVYSACRFQWKRAAQAFSEVVLAFASVLFLPTY